MPTPRYTRITQSQRTHPFSSCPEAEDEPDTQETEARLHQENRMAQDPPDGTSLVSPPYPGDAEVRADDVAMDEGLEATQATDASPWSPSGVDVREPSSSPEAITEERARVAASDEERKDVDSDEDMMGSPREGAQDGPARTRARRMRHVGGIARLGSTTTRAAMPASSKARERGDVMSPVDMTDSIQSDRRLKSAQRWMEDSGLMGLGSELSQTRLIPTYLSSTMRPGSRFVGNQRSDLSKYDVEVEIKHVDLRDSFLCGYLRIQGLTDDHPSLTTYFEGEIIGTKYNFLTQHASWGATEAVDMNHWSKFPPFLQQYARVARKGGPMPTKDIYQKEHVFMRWKERFLVPDHRVRTILGASFEGFYYICFDQVRGVVDGIYFHSKSEKYQWLQLKHVEDKGCFGAIEFR